MLATGGVGPGFGGQTRRTAAGHMPMADTFMQATQLCQPQEANTSRNIFGGEFLADAHLGTLAHPL